jgi:hypothetical protein
MDLADLMKSTGQAVNTAGQSAQIMLNPAMIANYVNQQKAAKRQRNLLIGLGLAVVAGAWFLGKKKG